MIKKHVEAGDEPWASCWKALQTDNLAKNTYTVGPSPMGEEGIYDMSGRRVQRPTKGMFIVNGQKELIK